MAQMKVEKDEKKKQKRPRIKVKPNYMFYKLDSGHDDDDDGVHHRVHSFVSQSGWQLCGSRNACHIANTNYNRWNVFVWHTAYVISVISFFFHINFKWQKVIVAAALNGNNLTRIWNNFFFICSPLLSILPTQQSIDKIEPLDNWAHWIIDEWKLKNQIKISFENEKPSATLNHIDI